MKLPIVEPMPEASDYVKSLFSQIVSGSVAVSIKCEEYTLVYYEGGIYSRHNRPPTEQERIEYAKIAAGRAREHYPTVAFFAIPKENERDLKVSGYVDMSNSPWEVVFSERI